MVNVAIFSAGVFFGALAVVLQALAAAGRKNGKTEEKQEGKVAEKE